MYPVYPRLMGYSADGKADQVRLQRILGLQGNSSTADLLEQQSARASTPASQARDRKIPSVSLKLQLPSSAFSLNMSGEVWKSDLCTPRPPSTTPVV